MFAHPPAGLIVVQREQQLVRLKELPRDVLHRPMLPVDLIVQFAHNFVGQFSGKLLQGGPQLRIMRERLPPRHHGAFELVVLACDDVPNLGWACWPLPHAAASASSVAAVRLEAFAVVSILLPTLFLRDFHVPGQTLSKARAR